MTKRRIVKKFIEWLTDGDSNVKIIVKFRHDSLLSPDGTVCFGVYIPKVKTIYIAGKINTNWVLESIAHEYCHYLQDIHNNKYSEIEARIYAENKIKCWIKTSKEFER